MSSSGIVAMANSAFLVAAMIHFGLFRLILAWTTRAVAVALVWAFRLDPHSILWKMVGPPLILMVVILRRMHGVKAGVR